MLRRLRRRLSPRITALVGVVGLTIAVVGLARAVDGAALAQAGRAMVSDPAALVLALSAFGLAFVVRSFLWTRMLPGLRFRDALAGVHLATGANHVLPFRLGEPFRVVSVVKRTDVPTETATASTLALRSADIIAVAVLGWLIGPATFGRVIGTWGWLVFAAVAVIGAAGIVWLRRTRHIHRVRLPAFTVAIGSMVAWTLEAVLVWQCARFAGIDLTGQQAVLITAAAVSAQTVAITPGGIGTYEAASVAAYTALGFDAGLALVAALAAHALKTLYTLVAGRGRGVRACPRSRRSRAACPTHRRTRSGAHAARRRPDRPLPPGPQRGRPRRGGDRPGPLDHPRARSDLPCGR